MTEDYHDTGDEGGSLADQIESTRRSFLKGSGAVASSGMFLSNAGIGSAEGRGDEEVPDEPAEGGQVRHFDVHAIEVDLVYNRYGLHQPNAAIYVLEENLEKAREASGETPSNLTAVDLDDPFSDDDHDVDTRVLQPLVLRANKGDIVEIEFHNDLDDRTASMHQISLPYEVEPNDGMDVGFNPDTTVDPGESITYRWSAELLGSHSIIDGANQAFDSADAPPQQANLLSRGLFGSMVVLPQDTTFSDPFTGEEEKQGRVQADIHLPENLSEEAIDEGYVPDVSFRQLLLHYHTPEGIETEDGDELTFPDSDEPQSTHAINYRADPTGNRIDPDRCDACGSSEFYNSWIHGDPGGGDNVYPMYLGDPAKVTAVGMSQEENHVHHLHGHRWKEIPPEDSSDTVDSQTIGLGAVYEMPIVPAFGEPQAAINDFDTVRPDLEFEDAFQVGVGGAHGSPGDYLFHCHLFPHYGEGMWGIMRVLDKETDALQTLPTNDPPLTEDSDIPGYPEFIPGEFGEAPPFPPYGAAGLDDFRDPTDEEEAALTRTGDIVPGAPYTDPCDPDIDVEGYESPDEGYEGDKREYTIVALPADVVYNDAGHHDPDGKVFVLEEDAEKVRNGEMNPEPLVIRANVGDCVEITLKNEIEDDVQEVPVAAGGPDKGFGKSNHIHFVSYDVLGSDSLATGFNYNQQALPEQDLSLRWYPDEEGTIFFHDHITGIENIMNGTFACLIVEPRGSEWLDPYSGEPIRSGTQAMIDPADGQSYREFALAYQDFAQLVDRDGDFVNPDEEHNENAGVMAINYRNAPYYTREDEDPAYVHSSYVHGDPSTPLLEAYENDPVRFRVWHAGYEEQHNFSLHGRDIEPEGLDPEDVVSQVIGTSEAFTFDILPNGSNVNGLDGFIDEELVENPSGLPIRDFTYGSTVVDDLWDGMWGIHRVFGAEVEHLQPLPDRDAPDGSISMEDLKEMGHPAPFSDFDWTEFGHEAVLLYDDDDDRDFPADKDARQNDSIDGNPPPIAPNPGDPCPDDAPVRQFDVSAFQTEITYNEYDDIDPYGLAFALDEHVEDMKCGDRELIPLTLFVNRGDCVEIDLTNRLDPDELDDDHPHPQMRTKEENLDIEWDRSERISLHPTRIAYNVLGSDGATVGFNWDQTVGPDETITYRWYADEPIGSAVLWDHADIRSNRHHGAYGQLIIEPEGADFLDVSTAEPFPQGVKSDAMLKVPDGDDRRTFAQAWADAQYIINEDDPDDCVVPPGPEEDGFDEDAPCNQIPDDPEDQGYPSINYASEPFSRRFDEDADPPQVYDSETHGDPATPLPRALLGDPVTFKINKVADKARGLSYHLSQHQWDRFRGVEESENIGVDDQFTVGKSDTIEPLGGAGGLADSTGDFVYQELKMRRRLEGGFWGIFRVRNDLDDFQTNGEDFFVQPLPDRVDGKLPPKMKKILKREGEGDVPPRMRPGWNVAWGYVSGGGQKSQKRDLLVGTPISDIGGINAGAAYLFFGPVDRPVRDLLGADVQFLGTEARGRAGMDVAIVDSKVVIAAGCDHIETLYVFEHPKRLSGTVKLSSADETYEVKGETQTIAEAMKHRGRGDTDCDS